MLEFISDLVKDITAVGWVSYIILGVLTIIGIANFTEALRKIHTFYRDLTDYFKDVKYSNQDLIKESKETARSLMEMVQKRQNSEPEFDFDNFQESSQSQSSHMQETNNIYYRDYAGKIASLRKEFLKRKLRDKELDHLYKHPTNYIGLRIVASKLMELSEKLDD